MLGWRLSGEKSVAEDRASLGALFHSFPCVVVDVLGPNLAVFLLTDEFMSVKYLREPAGP